MTVRAYVIIVSVLAGVIGLILLTIPVSINVGAKSYTCGMATYRNESAIEFADLMAGLETSSVGAESCDSARSTRLVWSLTLGIGGTLVAIGAALTRPKSTNAQPPPAAAAPA